MSTRTPRLLFFVIGGLLLFAAIMKIHHMYTDPFWEDGDRIPTWLAIPLLALEGWIGILLVLGRLPGLAWGLATLFFLAGSLFTVAHTWWGTESCGCLGAFNVSPSTMFLIDWGVFIVLYFQRTPDWPIQLRKDLHSLLSTQQQTYVGYAFAVTSLTCLGLFLTSTASGRSIWQENHQWIVIEGGAVQIEPGLLGETRVVRLTVLNRSDVPAEIVGGGTSCTCVTLSELPIMIPPKGSVELEVEIKFVGSPGPTTRKFIYYLRHPIQRSLLGVIHGTALANEHLSTEQVAAEQAPESN